MNSIVPWSDANSSDKQILALASLFDVEFSIDWVQELIKAKATTILMTLERACQEKLLKKKDLGIFYFDDQKIKQQMIAGFPEEERETLHRKIAALMIDEASDNEQAITSAASQLIHVSNDLKGCMILIDAGDRYRKKGVLDNSLKCYGKAIHDLEDKKGRQEETLFIKSVIGYSKNRLSVITPELTLSLQKLLKAALKRAEKLKDKAFQAVLLLHIASVEYERMKYISAQRYFFKGCRMAEDINDPLVIRTLTTCSVVHYIYSGHFGDAIKTYESIESVSANKTPDYSPSLKVGIMLGLSYAIIGQISQGLGMLNQLRDDALASGDPDAAARSSIYIASVLIMKNDLKNAVDQIHGALKEPKKLDLYTNCFGTILQAQIYFEKNDLKKSRIYLKKALETRDKYSFSQRIQLFEFCLAMERGNYPVIPDLSLEDEINMSIDIGNILNQGVAYRY
ncbi:hypothetical protein KAJ27_06990, partial [bacterium]|nr:hypothetical protein [bacterium]